MTNRMDNSTTMKSQTFGVEIEMTNISKQHALQIIANHYNTIYDTYDNYVIDNKGRKWTGHHDCSVASIGEGDVEIATPILKYEDIEDLQAIIRDWREAGAKSNVSYGCGIHIHVGGDFIIENMRNQYETIEATENGQNARSLRNLVNIFSSHEELLIKAIGMSESRLDHYTQKVNKEYVRMLNALKPRTLKEFCNVWYKYNSSESRNQWCSHYDNSRYHMVNLHALMFHGTIEYRMFEFHKNMHAGEMKAYIQLCLAISNYAKIIRYASPEHVQLENEKKAMHDWLVNMGLVGEEFKTARKMLTKRLSGDTGRRNNGQQGSLDDLEIA